MGAYKKSSTNLHFNIDLINVFFLFLDKPQPYTGHWLNLLSNILHAPKIANLVFFHRSDNYILLPINVGQRTLEVVLLASAHISRVAGQGRNSS